MGAKTSSKLQLIGAHTSASGGSYKALLHGKRIGANAIQFFTSNQKTWQGRVISTDELSLWFETKKDSGIEKTMSHDSYLINLGAAKPDVLEKSRKAFREELERCQKLELDYLNFHPGAHTTSSHQECLDKIVESLLQVEDLAAKGSTRLLLETTAGQGTTIGRSFEELAYIIQHTTKKIPIGVCIDTCHIFAAGYDIRTKEMWEKTLQEFDEKIGLKYLYAFHINDSVHDLGSKKDRHAPLGKGKIGMKSFEALMQIPAVQKPIKILETPIPDLWEEEIALLHSFAKGM